MDPRDERLPVALGGPADRRPGDLLLPVPPAAAHAFGCRCCGGRDPLATALSGAYVGRARGIGAWFDRVLLLGASTEAARVAAVLQSDPVARARFRLAAP